jgi:hypothetical protein
MFPVALGVFAYAYFSTTGARARKRVVRHVLILLLVYLIATLGLAHLIAWLNDGDALIIWSWYTFPFSALFSFGRSA